MAPTTQDSPMDRVSKLPEDVAYAFLLNLCQTDKAVLTSVTQLIDEYEADLTEASMVVGTPGDGNGNSNRSRYAIDPLPDWAKAGYLKRPGVRGLLHTEAMMRCLDCDMFFSPTTRRGHNVCRFHDDILPSLRSFLFVIPSVDFVTSLTLATRSLAAVGNLDFDEDADIWQGWDVATQGPMDTDQNRRDNPKGFWYACCERKGDEGSVFPCRKRNHHMSSLLLHARYQRKRKNEMSRRTGMGVDSADERDINYESLTNSDLQTTDGGGSDGSDDDDDDDDDDDSDSDNVWIDESDIEDKSGSESENERLNERFEVGV